MTRRTRFIVTLVAGLFLVTPFAAVDLVAQQELSREETKWLDRLPREDSNAVSRSLGWRAPAFPDSARWLGEPGPAIEDLRGKVVLVQTFATRGAGRSAATRLQRSIEPLADEQDFVAIAVHTPEGMERAGELVPALKLEVPVLLDEQGTWCDSVGAFRRPITYLVDRQGNVRYASVSARKIEEAARKLLSEPFDPETPWKEREEKPVVADGDVRFPTFTTSVGSSTDQRGQSAPPFYIEKMWKPTVADATNKVVVLDFWATWCGPCVAAIPHMNDIQNHYGNEVVCLGISDETSFDSQMLKRGLKKNDFAYGLAIDTSGRLKNFFGVRGIPHVAVLSGDWVVRWQGHPNSLNKDVLDSIVNANRALLAAASDDGSGPPPARWVEWLIDNRKP